MNNKVIINQGITGSGKLMLKAEMENEQTYTSAGYLQDNRIHPDILLLCFPSLVPLWSNLAGMAQVAATPPSSKSHP